LGELALFFRAPLEERFLLTLFLPIVYCSGPSSANWLCFARLAWVRFPASPYAPVADRNRGFTADLDPGCRPQGCRRENWLRFAFSAWTSPSAPCLLRVPGDLRGKQRRSGRCPLILPCAAARSRCILPHKPGSDPRQRRGFVVYSLFTFQLQLHLHSSIIIIRSSAEAVKCHLAIMQDGDLRNQLAQRR
jgi:hypothetical protein